MLAGLTALFAASNSFQVPFEQIGRRFQSHSAINGTAAVSHNLRTVIVIRQATNLNLGTENITLATTFLLHQ